MIVSITTTLACTRYEVKNHSQLKKLIDSLYHERHMDNNFEEVWE